MASRNQRKKISKPSADRSDLALKRRVQRNINRALAFDAAMFQHRTEYLILVLTLTYTSRWKEWMTLDDLRRDRDTLLNNAAFNNLLRGINGYVSKTEEGHAGGGLHVHLVIYYDASRRTCGQDDIHYAEAIRQYWEDTVTKGRGEAWNSNMSKLQNAAGPYGDVTGLIRQDDVAKRQGLQHYFAKYICKSEQQVGSRGPHDRMFNTSRPPRA